MAAVALAEALVPPRNGLEAESHIRLARLLRTVVEQQNVVCSSQGRLASGRCNVYPRGLTVAPSLLTRLA